MEITCLPTVNKEGVDIVVYQCDMWKCKKTYSYGLQLETIF